VSDSDPISELLSALSAELSRLGSRWYLFGAQAVVLWGRPRLTADVDVTVEVDLDAVPRLLEGLERRGFELRVRRDVDDFVARTRVLPLWYLPSQLQLDLVLAGPGLEEGFLERAVQVDVGGVAVPVISPEDLVVTKILAGRPKDLEDVRGILAERCTRLDAGAIRAALRLLEEALGQSDLLPAFEAEWRLASGRRD
jgi:hypothetical protein